MWLVFIYYGCFILFLTSEIALPASYLSLMKSIAMFPVSMFVFCTKKRRLNPLRVCTEGRQYAVLNILEKLGKDACMRVYCDRTLLAVAQGANPAPRAPSEETASCSSRASSIHNESGRWDATVPAACLQCDPHCLHWDALPTARRGSVTDHAFTRGVEVCSSKCV